MLKCYRNAVVARKYEKKILFSGFNLQRRVDFRSNIDDHISNWAFCLVNHSIDYLHYVTQDLLWEFFSILTSLTNRLFEERAWIEKSGGGLKMFILKFEELSVGKEMTVKPCYCRFRKNTMWWKQKWIWSVVSFLLQLGLMCWRI